MKPSSIPLAKPSGISLSDHTRHVEEETEHILDAWPFLEKKYQEFTGQELRPLLRLAAKWHDVGKDHPQWQKACRLDYEEYQRWRQQKGLDPYVVNASDHRKYERENSNAGHHLFQAKLRHEFASLETIRRKNLSLDAVVRSAIAAHHGKLGHRYKNRWYKDAAASVTQTGPFAIFWEELQRLSRRETLSKEFRAGLLNRFRFSAVRALLQLADTRASRLESEGREALVELKPYEVLKRFDPPLRPVQQAALEVAGEKMAILRAPTGSGKTYAALLWAEQQVRNRKADRLIIAMPTRFTSNALAISAAAQMGETGLYHSSAWHNYYRQAAESRSVAREMMRMAKLLAAPVTVCTIDHLLISLTGAREHHHSSFYFLANSAVVFDEADFYDPFVQANMVVLLNVLRELDVPVLIMSATVPDSARELYRVEAPIKSPQVDPNEVQPVKVLHWAGAAAEPKDVGAYLHKMLAAGTGIIYANTVARALDYYQFLERALKQTALENQVPLILYHSRFTEPDKKLIEERLLAMLGKTAWRYLEEPPCGIAILTQIGEMSVNISAPLMLSDVCPWDRLTQRLGRLLRFGEGQQGYCYLVEPRKDGVPYPAPYGKYDQAQKAWAPYPAFNETLYELQQINAEGLAVEPELLVDKVNRLYPEPPKFDGSAESNRKNLQDKLRANWLILPDTNVHELDESRVDNNWSSRQIPPQTVVFTTDNIPPFFRNFDDFFEFALEYGVSCPQTQVDKELRRGKESRIIGIERPIGEKGEKIGVYYTSSYSSKLGLAFLYGMNHVSSEF